MSELLTLVVFFGASFAISYVLISRVPSLLHTPLMSMTNAISAVTILGALLIFSTETDLLERILGGAAVMLATFNVAGGFVITHRMVKLFKKHDGGSSRDGDLIEPEAKRAQSATTV